VSRELKRWLMGIALIISTLISTAGSAEQVSDSEPVVHNLSLTHHDFEDWTFTPSASDTVAITNKSDIAHSIYITYPDGTVVNLDVQLPGETFTWKIPAAGDYLLQCWIHPIIRAEMTVSP
jgi:plastocyanin